ncbi:hypothetical protein QP028_07865 [Corynebacterium suedekumii]|uniref:Uncharacterized protein n=1 Tax=Corynebacterium suedekumii TaxID=3049801 RepID=A0ABY8VPL1_9CORY|nr:hypothetical protein [Corynebacterium suedekumii]WIM70956.1 hypothetical protein QP029_03815 [Corynebacterium suedekumii]WIM73351.1 hypothetical protein QP028_07865 [Corynebacterium suedekumii]
MFHVKPHIYVRIDMTIPGAGSVIHLAELAEIDEATCRMVRIIELDPAETIRGAATQSTVAGMANKPNDVVPHPDSYTDFPDIESRPIDAEEFEGLWAEATTAFPEL